MKSQAVIIREQGAPGVMAIEDVDVGDPGPGEVLLEQSAIGLNYMDVYQRSGYYPMTLPSGLGLEAVGKVLAVGDGVSAVNLTGLSQPFGELQSVLIVWTQANQSVKTDDGHRLVF